MASPGIFHVFQGKTDVAPSPMFAPKRRHDVDGGLLPMTGTVLLTGDLGGVITALQWRPLLQVGSSLPAVNPPWVPYPTLFISGALPRLIILPEDDPLRAGSYRWALTGAPTLLNVVMFTPYELEFFSDPVNPLIGRP